MKLKGKGKKKRSLVSAERFETMRDNCHLLCLRYPYNLGLVLGSHLVPERSASNTNTPPFQVLTPYPGTVPPTELKDAKVGTWFLSAVFHIHNFLLRFAHVLSVKVASDRAT